MQSGYPVKTAESALARAVGRERSGWWYCWAELVKARLTSLVLLTTLVGFYLGLSGPVDGVRLVATLVGMALLAGGGAALNEWMERDADALMPRTRHRPLPAGQMQPVTALWAGTGMVVAGLGVLGVGAHGLAAVLGAVTLAAYLGLYTPLKRVTCWNTWVGAVPGALPPVVGWAAAAGSVPAEAWSLFGIVACWQMPHFYGIAWLYRDEYAQAGFRMLPQVDPDGRRTGRQAVLWTSLLVPVSLLPWWQGVVGSMYAGVAAVLGLAYLVTAICFARERSPGSARRLFLASIVYLPLLLVFLTIDKVR
ncbi:protoheme IX farnesyltransferase [Limisphaera ngatamarikiensis]|uniref:Protoheme IX farnesyltransferase n=1 Tax=Limisphaera ngatamarikiensis TaxID=1324935 RepID=A0A6M1RUS8_9BACT|nr:heme o synthase [Limisphaera ngatamarikiensis]NGO39171.1 protoheme IX farnesyltransferase [Limisphaera ngatamarikiensis]